MNKPTWLLLTIAFVTLLLLMSLDNSADAAFSSYILGSQFRNSVANRVLEDIDCSLIKDLSLDRQQNLYAHLALEACSQTSLGALQDSSTALAASIPHLLSYKIDDYGGTDKNVIIGTDGYPNVTQAESAVWSNGSVIVVSYNDFSLAPNCYSGLSYSTNNGATWIRIHPLCSGHGTQMRNYGDPIVVYNSNEQRWYAGDLIRNGDCGNQGIGLWTSTDLNNWSAAGCVGRGFDDDRPSMWADSNGRMYVSWNDYDLSRNPPISVSRYDPNTHVWSTPTPISAVGDWRRNVQITGNPNGVVFVAGIDPNDPSDYNIDRTNYMWRSLNAGISWSPLNLGMASMPFPAPGDTTCSSGVERFAAVKPSWRYEGAGSVAAGPSDVVHYVYGQRIGNDRGDIVYIRSTDNGDTWATPIPLTDDAPGAVQWLPSLSITSQGVAFVSWHDRRNSGSSTNYEYWGRRSLDNGANWEPAMAISDVSIPQPEQPEAGTPTPPACLASDYNYHAASGNTAYVTWTDGRNPNTYNGRPQADIYFDQVDLTLLPTPTPCGPNADYTYTETTGDFVAGVDQQLNHPCENCTITIPLPFAYPLYGQTFNSVIVGENGTLGFVSNDNNPTTTCPPYAGMNYAIWPYWYDMLVDNDPHFGCDPCGIYTSTSGDTGDRIFNIEWRTCFGMGGKQNPDDSCTTGDLFRFEVRLYEGQARFDVVYGVIPDNFASGGVIAVQKDTGSRSTIYSCSSGALQENTRLIFTLACPPTPTRTPTRTPTPTPTNTPTVTPTFTPTPHPGMFQDVPPPHPFYSYIQCLGLLGIVSGYPCGGFGEPCIPDTKPYFRPYNNTTRGQTAKIIALAGQYSDSVPAEQQTFEDVPNTNTFWLYIELIVAHQLVAGYPCGGTGEPCVEPNNRPYYRPNTDITRGQIAKMVSIAQGWTETPAGQTFEDVPPGHTFYLYAERLASRGILNGYPCGNPEPCVPPANRPYFRPYSNATRAQISKIVALAFYPLCGTRRPAPIVPGTATMVVGPATPVTPPPPTGSVPPATSPLPSPIPTYPLPSPIPTGLVPLTPFPSPVPTGPVPTVVSTK